NTQVSITMSKQKTSSEVQRFGWLASQSAAPLTRSFASTLLWTLACSTTPIRSLRNTAITIRKPTFGLRF
ncbi:hypothetical protein BGZ65_000862, partial [Modicella reniformis]